MSNALIIFIRYPELGKIKTRLAKDLGEKKTFDFYKSIVKETIKKLKSSSWDTIIYCADMIDKSKISLWLDIPERFIFKQNKNHLGSKMYNAFYELKDSYKKTILIGSDCPTITKEIILNSYIDLNKNDSTIGPAEDGGYYLVGFKNSILDKAKDVFEDINWSSGKEYTETISNFQNLKLTFTNQSELNDIDDINDYKRYINEK